VKAIPIHEAKTHLSRLIQRALAGEEIIIAKRNEPLVRLEVIREKPRARRFGGLKSLVLTMGSSFDEPLGDFADYAPPAPRHIAEPPSEYQA
jgi:antitoxin (DNA-binding transcriptional repressor) of toxin-antitoxin stability system